MAVLLAAPFAIHAESTQSLQTQLKVLKAKNAELTQTIHKFEAIQQIERKNIKQFDDLDFVGWTGKNLKVFEDSHTSDVHVEGIMTGEGLSKHSADAQTYYPMLKDGDGVTSHPIKIAEGDWTVVVGATQSTVADTGAKAKGFMLTMAKWRDGKIAEEYLFRLEGDASKSRLNQYVK